MTDAAFYASCSAQTIRRRIRDGSLTAYTFGPRTVRIDLDELMSLRAAEYVVSAALRGSSRVELDLVQKMTHTK